MRNKRKRGLHKTAATDGIMKGKLYHGLGDNFSKYQLVFRFSSFEKQEEKRKKETSIKNF